MTGVWSELVGQDAAIEQLRRAAHAAGRIAAGDTSGAASMTHAWLITGPPGSGRSNAARAFAAALFSPSHGDELDSESHRALAGTHESMTVMSTQKSLISIDEVRDLVSQAHSAPVNAPWRVMIIEDADRMAERTSNVLLKAIEEPPPATVWILCAPSTQDVLTTIRSRCRNVNLRIPPTEAIAELLITRDGVDPDKAAWAAAAAQNHIGRAKRFALNEVAAAERQRTLDIPSRLTSLGTTVRLAGRVVDSAAERAKERTAERNAAEREELLTTLGVEPGKAPPPAVRAQVRRLEEEQKRKNVRARNDEIDSMFLELLSLYRDVLLCQLGMSEGYINKGEDERIRALAEGNTATSTLRRIDILTQARQRLATNMAPLLIVEAAFIGLVNPWLLDE
ncbi:DNA polymerase III subunit delta' [Brevibacterium luteolum]|uniref:DNA polymerase III subunit delta' n=1 Tax=Brevibacterium luteolum TaxID=199591 RepID=UPI0021AE962D|nr:DNA polymerase III subunit delta' [Brevibacterium luteolum]